MLQSWIQLYTEKDSEFSCIQGHIAMDTLSA